MPLEGKLHAKVCFLLGLPHHHSYFPIVPGNEYAVTVLTIITYLFWTYILNTNLVKIPDIIPIKTIEQEFPNQAIFLRNNSPKLPWEYLWQSKESPEKYHRKTNEIILPCKNQFGAACVNNWLILTEPCSVYEHVYRRQNICFVLYDCAETWTWCRYRL